MGLRKDFGLNISERDFRNGFHGATLHGLRLNFLVQLLGAALGSFCQSAQQGLVASLLLSVQVINRSVRLLGDDDCGWS